MILNSSLTFIYCSSEHKVLCSLPACINQTTSSPTHVNPEYGTSTFLQKLALQPTSLWCKNPNLACL